MNHIIEVTKVKNIDIYSFDLPHDTLYVFLSYTFKGIHYIKFITNDDNQIIDHTTDYGMDLIYQILDQYNIPMEIKDKGQLPALLYVIEQNEKCGNFNR